MFLLFENPSLKDFLDGFCCLFRIESFFDWKLSGLFRIGSLSGLQFADTSIDMINIPTGSKKQQKMFHIRNGENFSVYSDPQIYWEWHIPSKEWRKTTVFLIVA